MIRHSAWCGVVLLLAAACAEAPVYPDGTLEGLFAAERAFARASTERGIRASFLEYFAAAGVDFRPGPGPMRERMLARPAPADALALLLDWSPQAGAVARAGDLGFTTGPFALSNQRNVSVTPRYGYFFSVWKREDGRWRVAVDGGVSTPVAPPPDSLRIAPAVAAHPPAWRVPHALRSDRGKDALVALERAPRSLDPEPADAPSYFALLAGEVRVLREGSLALLGPDAVRQALAAPKRSVHWTTMGADASASDDFGYTYGRYVQVNGNAGEATGFYIHVWQRDDALDWRITAEVRLPAE
jgi:hypothetical protein